MSAFLTSDPIDETALQARLRQAYPTAGAVVSFVGLVRPESGSGQVRALTLEHYPGMTEASLGELEQEATARWPLCGIELVHRVGQVGVGEVIVAVGVASLHRAPAFAACAFLMDQLKTRVPLWKKEHRSDGEHWVGAREGDQRAAQEWSSFPAVAK